MIEAFNTKITLYVYKMQIKNIIRGTSGTYSHLSEKVQFTS